MSHNVYNDNFEKMLTIGNRQNYINNKSYQALKELNNLAIDLFELATTNQITHDTYHTLFDNIRKIQKPIIKIEEITDYEKSVFEEFLMREKEKCKK